MEDAHELGNLLTALLGSLEPLRRQPLDAQGRKQLAAAQRSASQLCGLHGRWVGSPHPTTGDADGPAPVMHAARGRADGRAPLGGG